MQSEENKTQDKQKEIFAEAETVDVVSEKPVAETVVEVPKTEDIIEEKPVSAEPKSEEVVVESETVETPKEEEEEEVKSEQSQNQTPPTAPIGEIPPSSSVETTADKQPQITPEGRTSPVAPPSSAPPRGTTFSRDFVQKLLIKARAKIQERKQGKLDKIMTLFDESSPSTGSGQAIANKDIQKLLRTSRVSAFRYLNILETQNKIKQVGNTGKSVFYTKT
jgi:hypothetical protein